MVTGWPAWYPLDPTSGAGRPVRWSISDRADEAAAEVAGQVPGDHDVDVEGCRAALEAAGWAVAVQEQGGSNVRA